VENLMRVGVGREAPPTRAAGKALERRPIDLLGGRWAKAQEGKDREAGSTVVRGTLWRGAGEAQESIGRETSVTRNGLSQGTRPWSCGACRPSGPQSRRTGCQERQEGMDAERRTALREGKALKGEPHERHRSTRPEGGGGSKPSREWKTLEAERAGAGIPGRADLPADVAVGAPNPMRVAGLFGVRRESNDEPWRGVQGQGSVRRSGAGCRVPGKPRSRRNGKAEAANRIPATGIDKAPKAGPTS